MKNPCPDMYVLIMLISCRLLTLMGRSVRWERSATIIKGAWCTVERTGEDEILCTFDEPVRAITPGQALVLYDGEYVLGGGTIL